MARKDLHEKPFDEATLTKLDIFERYLEAWLPTFLYGPFQGEIQIWDFFAGQGYDVVGQKGSAIRIMDVLKTFETDILKARKNVKVILNEFEKDKYLLLKESVETIYGSMINIKHLIKIEFHNADFVQLYNEKFQELKKGNNLIFLDQNGVKQITEKVFLELFSFPQTDFLFFISSSYFIRFAKDFKSIHPKLDVEEIRSSEYKKLHLAVLNLYKSYLADSNQSNAFLYPFSLMKNTVSGYNIYGLIFCAKHILAADKFLRIAWDKNRLNGQANYDIENDISTQQLDMFQGKLLNKVEKFQKDFEAVVLSGEIKTNKDAFVYALGNGHLPQHAEDVLRALKDKGKLDYEGRASINYNAIFKDKKVVQLKTVKK